MSLLVSRNLAYEALLKILRENDNRDKQALADAEALYNNTTEPLNNPRLSPTDYAYRQEAWAPAALAEVIVDKIASALYGRAVERSTGNKGIDSYFVEGWSNMQRSMIRISKIASIAASTFVQPVLKYPFSFTVNDTGIGNAVPVFDPDDLNGFPVGVIYEYYTRGIDDQIISYVTNTISGMHHVLEIVTKHQRDVNGNIVVPGIHLLFIDEKRVPLPDDGYNPMGDFLGAVFWRGAEHPTDANGKSDIIPLIKTLSALNELIATTHEKVVWSVHSPVVTNVGRGLEFRYGPREVWQISGASADNAFVKRLESDSDISSPLQLVDFLVKTIHETSRVPSVAVGDLEHVGNLSSGRALEIAMTPMIELIREKEMCAIVQEKELMAETMAIMAYAGIIPDMVIKSPYGNWLEPDSYKIRKILSKSIVEFAPFALPRDNAIVATTQATLYNGKLTSKYQAIKELHPDWTEEQIQEELDRIESEGEPIEEIAEPDTTELDTEINEENGENLTDMEVVE